MVATNCTRTPKITPNLFQVQILCWRCLIALGFSPGLFVFFAGKLAAQSPHDRSVVQVAGEPAMSRSPSDRRVPMQTASSLQELPSTETGSAVEPKRLPQATASDVELNYRGSATRRLNFIPPQRPIGQINIDLKSKPKGASNVVPDDLAQSALGEVPVVHAASFAEMLGDSVFASRRNHDEIFPYQPLYFEEVNLERYGRSCGPLQPAISGARFFGTIASMPYAMAVHHPNQAYTFRWPYEAGWGAPRVKELGPLKAKPALVQAGVVTGLFFVVP